MRLRVRRRPGRCRSPALGPRRSTFAAGEEMRTEISAKFRRAGRRRPSWPAAGFELDRWWTDAAGDFALSLSFAV